MHSWERLIRVPYIWEALRKAGLLKGYQKREYERLVRAREEIDARLARKRAAQAETEPDEDLVGD